MNEAYEQSILKVTLIGFSENLDVVESIDKEQNRGTRGLEKIIEFTHGKHMPHNAIHNVLIDRCHAKANPNNSECRKP